MITGAGSQLIPVHVPFSPCASMSNQIQFAASRSCLFKTQAADFKRWSQKQAEGLPAAQPGGKNLVVVVGLVVDSTRL